MCFWNNSPILLVNTDVLSIGLVANRIIALICFFCLYIYHTTQLINMCIKKNMNRTLHIYRIFADLRSRKPFTQGCHPSKLNNKFTKFGTKCALVHNI